VCCWFRAHRNWQSEDSLNVSDTRPTSRTTINLQRGKQGEAVRRERNDGDEEEEEKKRKEKNKKKKWKNKKKEGEEETGSREM